MTKAKPFGDLLLRIRREQGFPTAHGFYRSRDGNRTLQLSFRNYLKLEKGQSLPQPQRLKAILAALGLHDNSVSARELVRAYFTALGMDVLLPFAAAPAPSGDKGINKLDEVTARWVLKQRGVHLTPEQWKVIVASDAHYACYKLLVDLPDLWAIEDIARRARLPLPAARAAVKELGAAGILKLKGGQAGSALAGKSIAAPPVLPSMVGIKAALAKRAEDLLKTRAKQVWVRASAIRTSKRNFDLYMTHLEDVLDISGVYEDQDDPQARAFEVETRVFELFPQEEAKASGPP